MKETAWILMFFALLFGCASTGQPPEVGQTAPDFALADVSGDEVRLTNFRGKKNIVLVFYSDHT